MTTDPNVVATLVVSYCVDHDSMARGRRGDVGRATPALPTKRAHFKDERNLQARPCNGRGLSLRTVGGLRSRVVPGHASVSASS